MHLIGQCKCTNWAFYLDNLVCQSYILYSAYIDNQCQFSAVTQVSPNRLYRRPSHNLQSNRHRIYSELCYLRTTPETFSLASISLSHALSDCFTHQQITPQPHLLLHSNSECPCCPCNALCSSNAHWLLVPLDCAICASFDPVVLELVVQPVKESCLSHHDHIIILLQHSNF